ncbi:hypothetical protein AB0N06_37035 [Streptomyces sp. NPDC051020]
MPGLIGVGRVQPLSKLAPYDGGQRGRAGDQPQVAQSVVPGQ